MSTLSIIIVSWNTKDLLKNCISSIFNHTFNTILEICVVDNNSTDGTKEMLKKEYPQILLIENNYNEGYSRANNKGIKETKGEYILLLNSDTMILDNSLDKMISFISENENIGILGCKLIHPNGSLQESASFFPSYFTILFGGYLIPRMFSNIFGFKKFPGLTYLGVKALQDIIEVDSVVGACMLVKRKAIEEAGYLDENLFMYGEDIELCLRVKKVGWKIFYYPYTKILHYHGGSSKKSDQKEISMIRRLKADRYIYKKYHNNVSSPIFDLFVLSNSIIKIIIWRLILFLLPRNIKASSSYSYHLAAIKALFNYGS